MYKRKIKLWGLDKKNKEHEVLEILRLEAQRAAEGKRSTFVLRGRVVNMHDLRRYLKRKGRSLQARNNPGLQGKGICSGREFEAIDLVCSTPSPITSVADPSSMLDRQESFYVIFSQYLLSSIESGAWAPSHGSTSLNSSLSSCGRWVDILETINLGAARFNDGRHKQAMWHWRTAFTQLEVVVRSWNYYQLLNLISGIGRLAACSESIARMLLQHLSKLISTITQSENPQQRILKSLSHLDPATFADLLLFTRRACLPIFSTHFSDYEDFVLFWEAALAQVESRDDVWTFSPLLFARMVACLCSNRQGTAICLSAAERLITALEQSDHLGEAEYLSMLRIERLQSCTQDPYTIGQLFRARGYLARTQCRQGQRREARQTFLLAVREYETLSLCDRNEDQRHDWFMLDVWNNLIDLESTMGLVPEVEAHKMMQSTLVAILDERVSEQLRDEDLDLR